MSLQQQKILVVDTDQFIMRTLKNKLENEVMGVETVDQTWLAIEKLESNDYILLVLELVVPLFSGYEILDYLKKTGKNKTMPVVILTNLQQENDITRLMQYDIADYYLKSNVDMNTFSANVRDLLTNKKVTLSADEKEYLTTRLMSLSQQNSSAGTPKVKVLKCKKCEATLPPKTEFCPYCGTQVETEEIIKQNY